MKKAILILGVALSILACNKNEEKSDNVKTAYIDTSELIEKYEKFKDEDDKFKVKSQELGRPLEAKVKAFQNEAQSFQQNAQAKGPQWAQQKGAELQQREQQLQYAQQGMLQQLQGESGKEMDSLVTKYKKIFKEYGKEKGYDYVFGSGEAANVLYAKDQYDITKEIIKLVNDKYKAEGKKEEKTAEKK